MEIVLTKQAGLKEDGRLPLIRMLICPIFVVKY